MPGPSERQHLQAQVMRGTHHRRTRVGNRRHAGFADQAHVLPGQRIRELESVALKTGQTQIFIETPYRNTALLQALLQTLQNNTRLALSCGLTLGAAWSHSASVSAWKRDKPAAPLALPGVFCLGR